MGVLFVDFGLNANGVIEIEAALCYLTHEGWGQYIAVSCPTLQSVGGIAQTFRIHSANIFDRSFRLA
jgi:hypothetical protein